MPSFKSVGFLEKHKEGLMYLVPRSVAEKVPLKQLESQLA